jgi:hypothetical protein
MSEKAQAGQGALAAERAQPERRVTDGEVGKSANPERNAAE